MLEERGFTVWLTGLSLSGKTTLSNLVHKSLRELGITNVEVFDGDIVGLHLGEHGFTKEDFDTGVLRIGWVAHLLTKYKVANIVASVSAHRASRDEVRKMVEHTGGPGSFIEVYVDCPAGVCEKRDSSGIYARKKKGDSAAPAGADEYEPPHKPEVHIRTDVKTPEEGAEMILEHLRKKRFIS